MVPFGWRFRSLWKAIRSAMAVRSTNSTSRAAAGGVMVTPVIIWLLIAIVGLSALFGRNGERTIEPQTRGDARTWDEIALAYGAE